MPPQVQNGGWFVGTNDLWEEVRGSDQRKSNSQRSARESRLNIEVISRSLCERVFGVVPWPIGALIGRRRLRSEQEPRRLVREAAADDCPADNRRTRDAAYQYIAMYKYMYMHRTFGLEPSI